MKARFPIILGLVVLAVAAVSMAAPSSASAQIPLGYGGYGLGYGGYGLGYGGYGLGYGGSGLGYGGYGLGYGGSGTGYGGYGLGYGGYGTGYGGYGLGYGGYGTGYAGYGLGYGSASYTYPSTYSYAPGYLVAGAYPYNVEVPGVNFSSAGGDATPDSCWAYDSWCSYCTANSGSDLCKEFPPKPMPSH